MNTLQPNPEFFNQHFCSPSQIRLGIWAATVAGDVLLEDDLSEALGLPLDSTMYDYAEKLIEYARNRGWEEQVLDKLAEDLKQAFAQSAEGVLVA